MSDMSSLIEIKDLSLVYDLNYSRSNGLKEYLINLVTGKTYESGESKSLVRSVDDISLDLNEGERLGIVGLNGAGKSSLLKVISGIIRPTSGSLNVHGTVQPLIEVGAGFDPEFSGRENIYLNGYMLGFTKELLKSKEQEIIDFAELQKFIDTPVKYYSSGMTVRLAFTIATMIQPEILVIDEMLSAGDASFIKRAKERINKLMDQARLIVMVSHDLTMIEEICNRVIVMNMGKIVYDGPTEKALKFYLDLVSNHSEGKRYQV